ncbi:MAG: hypothetical protein HQK49_07760 [Oligoflexia bacterium]|nr:hypothetical protein [Oligoflexia bacterium]
MDNKFLDKYKSDKFKKNISFVITSTSYKHKYENKKEDKISYKKKKNKLKSKLKNKVENNKEITNKSSNNKTIMLEDLRWSRMKEIGVGENQNSKENIKKWVAKFKIGNFGDNMSGKLSNSTSISETNTEKEDDGHLLSVFKNIGQYLNYSDLLFKNGISGIVKVRIVFDKSGIYQEKLSKFDSTNGFVKVHVAKVLRESLGQKSIFHSDINKSLEKDFFVIDATFSFIISANRRNESFDEINNYYDEKKVFDEINNSTLYFKRIKYGEGQSSSTAQKVAYRAERLLQIVQNHLLLWKYRPNWLRSDKELTKEIYELNKLKEFMDDPIWNTNGPNGN